LHYTDPEKVAIEHAQCNVEEKVLYESENAAEKLNGAPQAAKMSEAKFIGNEATNDRIEESPVETK
jgi:hypothetical protein